MVGGTRLAGPQNYKYNSLHLSIIYISGLLTCCQGEVGMSIYQDKTVTYLTHMRFILLCVCVLIFFSVGAQNTDKRLVEIFLHILGNLEGNGVFFKENFLLFI
jgi:hypothetical protein